MQIVVALAVTLAFMVQSLMPSGYMPVFKADKIFEMTICFGSSQKNILVDENMNVVNQDVQSHPQDKHSDSDKPCFYSSFSAQTMASASFIAEQIEFLIYEEFVETDDHHPIVSVETHPYFSQGPPSFLS